jgi:hypothetical protein
MRLEKSFTDTEMAFIREFACGELYRLATMNPLERQERIRVAIMSACMQDKPFGSTGLTYAQCYRIAFKKPCELRRFPRESQPQSAEAMDDAGESDMESVY